MQTYFPDNESKTSEWFLLNQRNIFLIFLFLCHITFRTFLFLFHSSYHCLLLTSVVKICAIFSAEKSHFLWLKTINSDKHEEIIYISKCHIHFLLNFIYLLFRFLSFVLLLSSSFLLSCMHLNLPDGRSENGTFSFGDTLA